MTAGEGILRRHWDGAGVDIGRVVEELGRLEVALVRATLEAGEEHPPPRSCVLNLVVWAGPESRGQAPAVTEAARRVAGRYPIRSIVVSDRCDGAERDPDLVDAAIQSESRPLAAGVRVQREHLAIHACSPSPRRLASLVGPLLRADCPVDLAWTGTPPFDHAKLPFLLGVVDRLIVESTGFDDPVADTIRLAALARSLPPRLGLGDLTWSRLRPFREIAAQLFAPEERRPFLAGLERVEIASTGSGPGHRVGAALLAGWLAGALGWEPVRVESRADATLARFRNRAGGPVELQVDDHRAPTRPPGRVIALTLEGAAGGVGFRLRLRDAPGAPGRALVGVQIGSEDAVEQVLQVADPDAGDLLLELVETDRQDPVYLRSLSAAATLLGEHR